MRAFWNFILAALITIVIGVIAVVIYYGSVIIVIAGVTTLVYIALREYHKSE